MRLEFSKRTKLQALERSGGQCEYVDERGERCPVVLQTGKVEFDHIVPAALGGSADISNCCACCRAHHRAKTKKDVATISKANRTRAAHWGAKTATRPLPGSKRSPWKRKLNGQVVKR